jgi:phosphate starvation-inducible PhoH-like protein
MGYLPGDIYEKMAIYEHPYMDICSELTGKVGQYELWEREGKIEFMTTSFLRSLTWSDAVVLVDEAQNMTFHELNSIVTRLGERSRLIVCGDLSQTDLVKGEKTGFGHFLRVADQVEGFSRVELSSDDIVRSPFVKKWILACERLSS